MRALSLWCAIAFVCLGCGDGHSHDQHDHDHDGVPSEYAELDNPLAHDPGAAGRGRATFQRECAACHGDDARGHGPRADELTPPPGDLIELAQRDDVTDGYLYWRVSEGGEASGTAMPAWAGVLTAPQIWELISFLRDRAGVSP